MKENKKSLIEKLLFIVPLSIILISFLIILFKGQLNFGTVNFENLGGYGSFIGGIVGTFLTIVATLYIYKTYHSQKEELQSQKSELILQKQLIAQQQFESTFFNLINLHRELKNNLTTEHRIFWFTEYQIDHLNKYFPDNDKNELFNEIIINRKKSGFAVLRILHNDLYNLYKSTGINKHVEFYKKRPDLKTNPYFIEIISKLETHLKKINEINNSEIVDKLNPSNKNFEKEKIKICFELLFEQHSDVISHYCRNVYHILKYIRENEENGFLGKQHKKHQNYADIFQSQLSVDEQFILFYNFIHFNDEKNGIYSTINLVNHYKFLENLGSNNLINKDLHNNKKFYSFDIK